MFSGCIPCKIPKSEDNLRISPALRVLLVISEPHNHSGIEKLDMLGFTVDVSSLDSPAGCHGSYLPWSLHPSQVSSSRILRFPANVEQRMLPRLRSSTHLYLLPYYFFQPPMDPPVGGLPPCVAQLVAGPPSPPGGSPSRLAQPAATTIEPWGHDANSLKIGGD